MSSNADAKVALAGQLGWGLPFSAGTGVGGGLDLGVTFDYFLSDQMSVGAYGSDQILNTGNILTDLVHLNFGATFNYHMNQPGLYIGANLGMTRILASALVPSANSSNINFGGQVGFDAAISSLWGMGGEARYIFIMADDPMSELQLNVNFKFWF